VKITKLGKKKNDKDEIGNILLNHILSVYCLAQRGGGRGGVGWAPPLDLPMYIFWVHFSRESPKLT
jgi:hypothetical protein